MPSPATIARALTLTQSLDIARDYRSQGLTLTLRQLYYQHVSRGYIDNSQKAYKRLGDIIAKGRLSGAFPWDMIEDRTRSPQAGSVGWAYLNTEDALDSAASEIRAMPERHIVTSKWWGQRRIVCVWVEKEALASVFETPCRRLGVPWFVCRGYPSLSALKDWVEDIDRVARIADTDEDYTAQWSNEDHIADEGRTIEEIVVLYFGDHDPDGFEIPRAAERRVHEIAHSLGIDLPPVRFERVALNMDQIEAHSPPPYPAKPSSSRFAAYIEEHDTTDAWELDALDPATLRDLITTEVEALFDDALRRRVVRETRLLRAEMRDAMRGDWLENVFD